MNNLNFSNQQKPNPLLTISAIALGVYALDQLFSQVNDTLNYTLWYRNRLVYHGICYADRMDARLYEHGLRGIKFDEYDYDSAKQRAKAIVKERKLIQRDCPQYNIHHNY